MKGKNQFENEVQEDNVYKCEKIIERSLSRATKDDYALIKLARKVKGRTPLKFRKAGTVQVNDDILVIGHPSGLPTKLLMELK
jgi:hypothetical protein